MIITLIVFYGHSTNLWRKQPTRYFIVVLYILKTTVRDNLKKCTFVYQEGFVSFENLQQGVSNPQFCAKTKSLNKCFLWYP